MKLWSVAFREPVKDAACWSGAISHPECQRIQQALLFYFVYNYAMPIKLPRHDFTLRRTGATPSDLIRLEPTEFCVTALTSCNKQHSYLLLFFYFFFREGLLFVSVERLYNTQ